MTQQTVVVGLWHGRHYQSHQVYQNRATEHAAFRQYIAGHEGASIHLIVDVIEEEYQLEVLPHATAAAKHEMRSRKLTQFSRNSVYKTAWFLNRKKAMRKEDSYVLLALTNTVAIQQWLDIVQSEEALLVGVTTLPMVSQQMVGSAKSASTKLLLCERLSTGLRLSYLESGRLRMSRLIRVEAVPSVDFYLSEIEKMRLYLLSQKIISSDGSLQVSISALDAASDGVATELAQHGLACGITNRQHDIRKHHLRQLDVEAHPELLHMQWLASGNKVGSLASAEATKNYRLHCLSKRLAVGISILFVVGLLTSGYLLYQGYVKNEQIQPLVEQSAALSKKQAFIVKAHPEMTVASSDLKSAVGVAKAINQVSSSPWQLMQVVSAVLADEPAVVINRLRYIESEHLHINDEENRAFVESPHQVNTVGWVKIGFLSAEIQPFTGDYPAALVVVRRVAEKLRSATSVMAVNILQRPVNIISSSALQGSTREQELVPASATFKLKIVFKADESKDKT